MKAFKLSFLPPSYTAMEATLRSFLSSKSITHFRPENPFFLLKRDYKAFGKASISPKSSAIARAKKRKTIEAVKAKLENCQLFSAIRCAGFNVKQFQYLKGSLPESTKIVLAKNSLVRKAIKGTKWEALNPCVTGNNGWFFVHSEEIPEAIKPVRSFQSETKLEFNDFSGAVFQGKFYTPDEFEELETLPSKAEICAEFLGSLHSPAMGLLWILQPQEARDEVMAGSS